MIKKKIVNNEEIKEHLKSQDNTLDLLNKAVSQIAAVLQENSVKVAHLFRWKEREREKHNRITFKTANIAVKVMTVIGCLVVAAAIIYGGYKLVNWILYG